MRMICGLAVAFAAAGSAAGESLRQAVAQRIPTPPQLPFPDGIPPLPALPVPDSGIPPLPEVPIPDTGIPPLPTTRTTSDCRAPCLAVGPTCASLAFVTNGVCNCLNFFGSSCSAPGGLPVSISGLPNCPSTCASPPVPPNVKAPSGAASLGVSLAAAAAAAMLAL